MLRNPTDPPGDCRSSPQRVIIAFEGLDGVGKSTQARLLRQYLEAVGLRVSLTGVFLTDYGRHVRSLFLDGSADEVGARTQLHLLASAMSGVVDEMLKMVEDVVLLDRFFLTTYAYHGGGLGVPSEMITRVYSDIMADCMPGLTIVLDLPSSAAARRRGAARDRVEKYPDAFHSRVGEEYRRLASLSPAHRLVSSEGGADQVFEAVLAEVLPWLRRRGFTVDSA